MEIDETNNKERSYCSSGINEYVFGFGSIINTSTHGPWLSSSKSSSPSSSSTITSTSLPGRAATITKSFGLKRGWNFRSKTGFTALGVTRVSSPTAAAAEVAVKEEEDDDEQDAAAAAADIATDINGVLFRITPEMLEGFDRREVGYDRIELPHEYLVFDNDDDDDDGDDHDDFNVKPTEQMWVYIPHKDSLAHADVDHPVLQSYVDTVMQGCLEWGGERMCEQFVLTTHDWSPYFLNDTPSSRRPWLFRKDYTIIDRVLSKYTSLTHFQDRRHPEEFASAFLIKLLRGSWAVPKRNPSFIGRDVEIEEIHRRLVAQRSSDQGQGGSTTTTTTASSSMTTALLEVVGMGGVGKTQLVTEYCYRYFPSYYGLIIWLKAQSDESIVSGYRQLMADTTGNVDVKEKATDEVVAEIKARLFRSKIPWLLVFDNLEDHSLLDKFLPNGGTAGHVLVTSRLVQQQQHHHGGGGGGGVGETIDYYNSCLFVMPFQPSESVELLVRSAGQHNLHSDAQIRAAHQLAERLGHLPLALSMAAAYMYRCDVDCLEYLSRYIKSEDDDSAGTMVLGNEGVSSSLSLSLNAIKNENINAWRALRMLAWLGPDQITKKILRSLLSAKVEQEVAEEEAAALASAEAAAIILNSSSATPLLVLGGAALFGLIRSRRNGSHTGPMTVISLLALLTAATGLAAQSRLKRISTTTAFHSPAFQTSSGAYEIPTNLRRAPSRGDVFERTDEIWNILKSFSLLTVKEGQASMHRLLAQSLRASQDEDDSNRNLEICLRALLKLWTFKPDQTSTWQSCTNFLEHIKAVVIHSLHHHKGISQLDAAVLSREAGVFSAMVLNSFVDAQTSLELSLQILERAKGSSVPGARAAAYHELGRVYRYKGHFKDSEEALLKALDIYKRTVKSDPSARRGLAATLHELGVLEVKQHNVDDAADFLQQALDLRRSLERELHREDAEAACASTLHQLAAVHLARKPPALDTAQSLLNEALSLNMQIGQRAATLKQLARVNIRQGEFDKADQRLAQAKELYAELYGEETLHINVAAVKFQQGALAFQREQLDQAWLHFSECLRARKVVYSYLQGNHIEVSTVLHELGCVAVAQGRFDKACKLLESEKEILDRICESSSYQRGRLYQARLNNLTWLRKCAKEIGDDEKAREIAVERSELVHAAKQKGDIPCGQQRNSPPSSPRNGTSMTHQQVNLLQQEALRCRLVARQYALAESRNRDSAAKQLTIALTSLSKEIDRYNGTDGLYDAVVQFHMDISNAISRDGEVDNRRPSPIIFEACDKLRDLLREQGTQVNDTISRKVRGK